MASVDDLLREYQPVVRFDSHEAFFAHDVRAMADNAYFLLTRADQASAGSMIADRSGGLDLEFLAETDGKYPNGAVFVAGDHFGLSLSGPEQFADRIGDYRQMERELEPRWRNFVYGHGVGPQGERVTNADGEVWLQYWFFYIYNDAQFGGRVDLHEGDWEMVQFRLESGIPKAAVYAQHAYAEQQPWSAVDQDSSLHCPVVYSGRGSHASYFEAGLHRTFVKFNDGFLPLWWDAADGRGPEIRQQLVILDDDQLPGWARWAGHWGGTMPHLPPIDGESPQGPKQHGQWGHPAAFAAASISHEKQGLRDAPVVALRRSPPGLKLRFDFTGLPDPPDRLVITASAEGDAPVTETIVVDTLARGRIATRGPLDAGKAYTVDVSTISASGVPTSPAEKPVYLGPERAVSPGRLLEPLFAAWGALWLWIGARLARRVARPRSIVEPSGSPAAPLQTDAGAASEAEESSQTSSAPR
ncbi:MAG TPA: hypothetical protein VMU39_03335 [Solirubrobacteraceae bacterium]|nr:hypothetical protein [Solirubrobacteraceae bacterium]